MSRSELNDKGWRRHSIISLNSGCLNALNDKLSVITRQLLNRDGAIAIICTYDCAVIDADFEREPWLQLLIACPESQNDHFIECKNPRKIHFPIEINDQELNYEVNAAGICQVERQLLIDLAPDNNFSLSEKTKENLNYWIAERYRQVTWPDAFNEALRPANRRIKRFFQRYNDFLSAIYVQLNTYEELETEKYQISVLIAIRAGLERSFLDYVKSQNTQLADSRIDVTKNHIISELRTAFGDEIEFIPDLSTMTGLAIEVEDEGGITLSQVRTHFRYSPYSISVGSSPKPVDSIPRKI